MRIAATHLAPRTVDVTRFRGFLDELGIARDTQVIRAQAHRGADACLELTVDVLIPEVTVTDDGIYWHPVSADDQLVTRPRR